MTATAQASVADLAVEFGRVAVEHDPVFATVLGLHDRSGDLTELTPAARAAAARAYGDLRRRLDELEVEDPDDELDRRGLAAVLDGVLAGYTIERTFERNPFAAPQQALSSVLTLLLWEHVDGREQAIAGRVASIPRYLEQARALLEPDAAPPLWVRMAEEGAAGGAVFLDEVVTAAVPAAGAFAEEAARAMRTHAAWLAETVAPAAAGSYSLGEDGLAHLLERVHLLDEGPAAVAARGRALLERGHGLLREIAAEREWRDVLAEARASHPAAADLVDAYRAELERLREFCFAERLVTDPEAPADVQETPEFLRPVFSFAAYLPTGAFDPVARGRLWITPPADPDGLSDHSHAAIQPVTAHEGYPGHHLQFASVKRVDRLTRRLHSGSALMSEGWGLYVEELMHETGYYSPQARLVQLAMTQWRAARIVADMGLHTGELDVAEAVDLLVEHAGITRGTAEREVQRYTMTPTQPFTYLYGAEEIRRIRAAYLERPGHSLRAFHDRLLSFGHLPPALVAEALTGGDAAAAAPA